jgi:hypothetical protein
MPMRILFTIAVLVASVVPVQAGFIVNADGHSSLDGMVHQNAILDENTNLLWLDMTETDGRSLNQVAALLGAGQEYDGWNLATLGQMETLLLNADIPYPTPFQNRFGTLPGFNQPISDFLDIYGSPSRTGAGDQMEVWIRTGIYPGIGRIVLSDGDPTFTSNPIGHRAILHLTDVVDADTAYNEVGVALVRSVPPTSPVPEPSSLVLLATGAIGLIGYRRRKRKQAA